MKNEKKLILGKLGYPFFISPREIKQGEAPAIKAIAMQTSWLKLLVLVFAILLLPAIIKKDRTGEMGFGNLFAQQVIFSSQYYLNRFVINPAFTGNSDLSNAFLSHRSQWIKVKGAPQYSCFTIDAPVKEKGVGVGLKLYSYTTDILSQVGAFASYSYKIQLSETSDLRFGLSMGMLNNNIDFGAAVMRDKADPFFLNQQQNKTVFSADLGLAFTTKKLELGLAIPQMLGNSVVYGTDKGYIRQFQLDRHFQGTLKYEFTISQEKNISAYPLIMLRAVKGAPIQFDINAVVDLKSIGWLGVTYHSNYAVAISGGVRYKSFSLGYSYDLGMSPIKAYTGSSTEFLLSYTFIKKIVEEEKDLTKDVVWAEQIQSTTAMTQPLDYDDEYWKSLNKNVDKTQIFNTIVDAVLSGKLQAFDIVTNAPMSLSKVKSSLVKMNGKKPKKVTKSDISKVRMNEKWVWDKKALKLIKQITRIDLLIGQKDKQGDLTGNDMPLFYVKLRE